jgi:hypothetical protein
MLIKVILMFLLIMAAIGMIGKALFPGHITHLAKRSLAGKKPPVCKRCGRHVIGRSGCDCRKG